MNRGFRKMVRKRNKTKGFSFVEMLVTVAILSISLSTVLGFFVYCLNLVNLSSNMTKALHGAQGKMEDIRDHSYSLVATDYAAGGTPGNTFDVAQLKGKGVIYINSTNANLLQVKVTVSWQDQSSRIIGEDLNLNGALDAGEDKNGNGELDSPVSVISLFAMR